MFIDVGSILTQFSNLSEHLLFLELLRIPYEATYKIPYPSSRVLGL